MEEETIERLREQMRLLDLELVALASQRVVLAKRVGEIKCRQGISTVDYAQERAVLDRARSAASERGLDPRVAEDLFTRLIRVSVSAQVEDRIRSAALGEGKSAVVIGGAGRMGRWLRHFLTALGYTTGVIDPAAAPDDDAWARRVLPSAELVMCSIPPAAIAKLYDEFAARPPAGVVVDIASIKTPVIEPIRTLQGAGVRVASIHPMFGPSAVLLRDADVVICDTGDAEATAIVEGLFRPTTARLVRLALADHDRIMADLLSTKRHLLWFGVDCLQETQRLVGEDERVSRRVKQSHSIAVHSILYRELQPRIHLGRHLRTVMQERLSAPRRTDVLLEPSAHHLVEHLEERHEVALARAVCTNKDVQRTQLKVHRLD
jgi:chorismate mutase / prephenate dehydrogenase